MGLEANQDEFPILATQREYALHDAIVHILVEHRRNMSSGGSADVVNPQCQQLFAAVTQQPAGGIIYRDISSTVVNFDVRWRNDRDHWLKL